MSASFYAIAAMAADDTFLFALVLEATDQRSGKLLRLRLRDGSAEVISAVEKPNNIATDRTHVYWTDEGSSTVRRTAKDGSATAVLWPDQYFCDAIAVFGTEVFWSLQANFPGGTAIFRMLTSSSEAPVAIARGGEGASGLLVDAEAVYFSSRGRSGKLRKVSKSGGDIATLVPGDGEGGDLSGDENFVYWAASDSVVAVDKRSGATAVIAPAQSGPARLANDERRIYWVNTGSQPDLLNTAPPGVYSVPISGGRVERLATLTAGPNAALALTSSDVYWGDGPRVRRAPKFMQ